MCGMSAEAELDRFIARFTPEMQGRIRACRDRMRRRFPNAVELVYDNYNFLVIAYSPTPRASDAVISLAADKHGVNLCFLVPDATRLPDPSGILRGTGKRARNTPLESADVLDDDEVLVLLAAASAEAPVPTTDASGGELVIRSVSPNQRPRR